MPAMLHVQPLGLHLPPQSNVGGEAEDRPSPVSLSDLVGLSLVPFSMREGGIIERNRFCGAASSAWDNLACQDDC